MVDIIALVYQFINGFFGSWHIQLYQPLEESDDEAVETPVRRSHEHFDVCWLPGTFNETGLFLAPAVLVACYDEKSLAELSKC
jgi:hypothetical protein